MKKSKIIIEPIKSAFLALAGFYKAVSPIAAEKIRSYLKYSEKQ